MEVRLAWRTQVDFLALCRDAERGHILAGAERVTLPAGRVADARGRLDADVIESGVVRAFQVAEDGREATIGYLYGGEYLGALPALEPLPHVRIQPLTETVLLRLNPQRLLDLFDQDDSFARAVAVHTATILGRVVRVVTVRTLGSVRQRVAYDLCERATEEQLAAHDVVLKVTQAELADSVGSAREVVSRAIADLRQAGIVATAHGQIRILDPERITRVVQALVV